MYTDPVPLFRLAAAAGWPADQIERFAGRNDPITLRSLTETVSQHAGVPVTDIVGPTRRPDCVRARHIVSWLARRFTNKSATIIVHHLGRHNHTTALWGAARIDLAIREAGILPPPLNTPRAWTVALWNAKWPLLRYRNPMRA
jgi:hypothetical protein